jgi:hypothetical protein
MKELIVSTSDDIRCPFCNKMISEYDPEEFGDIEECGHLILQVDPFENEEHDLSGVDVMIHVEQGPPSGERLLSLGFKKS